MTKDALGAAFKLYTSNPDWDKLQYGDSVECAFMAGWDAHAESLKQCTMSLGGGHDYTSPSEDFFGIPAGKIYEAYPRHVGRQDAIKAIDKAIKTIQGKPWVVASNRRLSAHDYLISATTRYAKATESWPAEDKKFIPHPATWFNRGSYDDDPAEWQRGAPAPVSQFSRAH